MKLTTSAMQGARPLFALDSRVGVCFLPACQPRLPAGIGRVPPRAKKDDIIIHNYITIELGCRHHCLRPRKDLHPSVNSDRRHSSALDDVAAREITGGFLNER